MSAERSSQSSEHEPEPSVPPADSQADPAPIGELPDLEPMTFSLLGRFFAVPLVIIGTIVGGAILVVLLFGGPASPDHRTIDDLLQALESGSGEKSLGVLLPREKELWQTALELSVRMDGKDKEASLTEAELTSVAARLSAMVLTDLDNVDRMATIGAERTNQRKVRSRRLEFLIGALGRTERPEAVDVLIEVVRRQAEPYVQVAMQMLGNLHALEATREAVEPILALLKGTKVVETRLVACTALSVLAERGDRRVTDALASARLVDDGEVAWAAGLALARLGDSAGKSTLLDLLDRSFLASGERYRVTDESGTVRRYPLPPQRVDGLMLAAMDAARNLSDADLWETIQGLESDPSPAVRARASEMIKGRASGAPTTTTQEQ